MPHAHCSPGQGQEEADHRDLVFGLVPGRALVLIFSSALHAIRLCARMLANARLIEADVQPSIAPAEAVRCRRMQSEAGGGLRMSLLLLAAIQHVSASLHAVQRQRQCAAHRRAGIPCAHRFQNCAADLSS